MVIFSVAISTDIDMERWIWTWKQLQQAISLWQGHHPDPKDSQQILIAPHSLTAESILLNTSFCCLIKDSKPIRHWRCTLATWLDFKKSKRSNFAFDPSLPLLISVLQMISTLSSAYFPTRQFPSIAFAVALTFGPLFWILALSGRCNSSNFIHTPKCHKLSADLDSNTWDPPKMIHAENLWHSTVSFHVTPHNPSTQIATESLSAFHRKNATGVLNENLHDPLQLSPIAITWKDNGRDVA